MSEQKIREIDKALEQVCKDAGCERCLTGCGDCGVLQARKYLDSLRVASETEINKIICSLEEWENIILHFQTRMWLISEIQSLFESSLPKGDEDGLLTDEEIDKAFCMADLQNDKYGLHTVAKAQQQPERKIRKRTPQGTGF